MNAELSGKTALVTGASGGIGQAAALELARRGADVAVHYHRNEKGARETAERVKALGRKAVVVAGDVARRDAAVAVVKDAARQLAPIAILVNNAGDLIQRKPLVEMPEELWRQVIDLNLSSVLYASQAAVPEMLEKGEGAIVNITSLAAHNGGGPGALAYAAAKGGLISLTKAMAKELAPKGVRVNAVSPGLIGQTSFHARLTAPDAFAAAEKTVPLGRAGTPEEVAHVIAFLCGPGSAYLVGETIEVNGGLLMR